MLVPVSNPRPFPKIVQMHNFRERKKRPAVKQVAFGFCMLCWNSVRNICLSMRCDFSSSRMSSSGSLIHVFHIGAVVLLKCKAQHQCFIHIQHFLRRDFPQISQNPVLIYGAQLLQSFLKKGTKKDGTKLCRLLGKAIRF